MYMSIFYISVLMYTTYCILFDLITLTVLEKECNIYEAPHL